MAVFDNDGTVNREIGKVYDHDGTTHHPIFKVYDNDGTVASLIYQNRMDIVINGIVDVENAGGTAGDITKHGYYLQVFAHNKSYRYGYFTKPLPISQFNTLCIDHQANNALNYGGDLLMCPGIDYGNGSTFARIVRRFDISNIKEDGYLYLEARAWDALWTYGQSTDTHHWIYNLWLE